MVRFYTPGGIGTVHSDPTPIIEYLMEERKREKSALQDPAPDTIQIGMITDLSLEDVSSEVQNTEHTTEVSNQRQEQLNLNTSEEAEQYREVVVHPDYPDQKVKIGRELSKKEAADLTVFLQTNLSVFAWTPAHMPGIPEEVAIHRLNLSPQYPPIQQKARRFGPLKKQP